MQRRITSVVIAFGLLFGLALQHAHRFDHVPVAQAEPACAVGHEGLHPCPETARWNIRAPLRLRFHA